MYAANHDVITIQKANAAFDLTHENPVKAVRRRGIRRLAGRETRQEKWSQ